jgi:uncharacterized protein (DUF433 family)
MELESYFDFLAEDAIRLTGTRVGIEIILRDYQEGASPEEIVLRYPTLSLEQVHATITYYLANREKVEAYLDLVRQRQEKAWQEQQRYPSAFVRSLRERVERQRQALRQRESEPSSVVEDRALFIPL